MDDLVYLLARNGHVIGFTVPLHDTIAKQWAKGDLRRVNADGSPFVEPATESATEQPAAPAQPEPEDKPTRARRTRHKDTDDAEG